jgi:hypothetical protein
MGHVLPSAGSKATYSIALGGSRGCPATPSPLSNSIALAHVRQLGYCFRHFILIGVIARLDRATQ